MNKLEDFFDILSETPSDKIINVASDILVEPYNWPEMIATYVANLPDSEFVSRVKKMNIPSVEPRNMMIYEKDNHFQVVVNLYNLNSFNRLLMKGNIGPHYHHFSFVSRILRGGYRNINYKNSGTLQNPILSVSDISYCDTGTVFALAWDAFHQIMKPEHFTVSLMIRSKPVQEIDYGGVDKHYGTREILRKRRLLLEALNDNAATRIKGKSPQTTNVDFSKMMS